MNVIKTVRRLRTAYLENNLPYKRILLQLQRKQVIESTTEDENNEILNEVKLNINQVFDKKTTDKGLGYMACTL